MLSLMLAIQLKPKLLVRGDLYYKDISYGFESYQKRIYLLWGQKSFYI